MGSSDDSPKDMRRRLRKKLKEDLIKVQRLSSKIDARAMQLLQSRSAAIYPGFNDAQFSVNASLHHAAPVSEQQFLGAGNARLAGAELIGSKRTPKASQAYKKSEFLVGTDKLPSPVKSNVKRSESNGQAIRTLNKRNLPQSSKNSKMHCRNILKKLMDHEDGWIFNEPVDPVKLGLSDYHSVVKKPMDLGTIKGRLDKKQYKSLSQFADDVKLTFNNAMSYNPPGNDVHQSARMLLTVFQREWDALKERFSETNGHEELDVLSDSLCLRPEGSGASSKANVLTKKVASSTRNPVQARPGFRPITAGKPKALVAKSKPSTKPGTKSNSFDTSISEVSPKPDVITKSSLVNTKAAKAPAKAKAPAPARPLRCAEKAKKMRQPTTLTKAKATVRKKAMNYEEKVGLQTLLGQLPQRKLEELIYIMREKISNISEEDDEIEVDLDSFDDDTLWELHRRASDCLENHQTTVMSRKRPGENNSAGKTGKRQKVALERIGTPGKRSSSESGSSTESDSGNSSTSDSDG